MDVLGLIMTYPADVISTDHFANSSCSPNRLPSARGLASNREREGQ